MIMNMNILREKNFYNNFLYGMKLLNLFQNQKMIMKWICP